MKLADSIRNNFEDILTDNGTTVTNLTTKQDFTALVTSGDFIAAFTESDQETELAIQLTMFNEHAPKTGNKLLIEGTKYIVQSIQSRVNGVITKATAYKSTK